jgi:hypothetical protein
LNGSNSRISRIIVASLAGVVLTSCSLIFDTRRLPPGTPPEKNDWYGEFYNERQYAECLASLPSPHFVDCEYKRLMRVEEPEYWPYPNVPKPKWPEAPNPPVYRFGMSSKAYFEALCKAEAGEFIYRTVENVEGFYQIRPRKKVWDNEFQDRYVMEDPYGYTDWEARDTPGALLNANEKLHEVPYSFIEAPPRKLDIHVTYEKYFHPSRGMAPPMGAIVERYFGSDGSTSASVRKEYDTRLKSRYGYTWRGIKRPHDRDMGIAGGELIVVDLQTGEILAMRRGFARSGNARARSGINWESTWVCPRLRTPPWTFDKSGNFSRWFIAKVLRPVDLKNSRTEGR